MGLALLLGTLSLVLFIVGLTLLRRSQFKANNEAIVARLSLLEVQALEPPLSRFEKQRLKMGITLPFGVLVTLVCAWGLVLCLVGLIAGAWLMGCLLLGSGGALHLYLTVRYRRRVKKMVNQLPQMLEHMVRSIQSGRTLGDAALLAMHAAAQPLQEGIGRSRRYVERGGKLEDAMDNFALLYGREEFRLLAMGLRVNQRYGGSAIEMLQGLVLLIREREQAGAQLKAMTGETRVSALVLGGMPLAMAAYIFMSNPQFLLGLWLDPSGKLVLLSALFLQSVGSFLLWRMLRSI